MDPLLERVVAQLGPLEAEPEPLRGGITNRNYRLRLGGSDYVLRVPGEGTALLGIDRRTEGLATELSFRLGIGPELAYVTDDFIVTHFIAGRQLEAAELGERVEEVAAALRLLHDSGATLPVDFHPLTVATNYAALVRERGGEVPAEFERALARAEVEPYAPAPCHNDLLAANFLEDERGHVRIVDWEYAGMGDRRFDLANFAVNNGIDDEALLAAYGSEHGPLGEARFLSDLREAMWGVLQSLVSDLDFDFDAYARKHFARLAV